MTTPELANYFDALDALQPSEVLEAYRISADGSSVQSPMTEDFAGARGIYPDALLEPYLDSLPSRNLGRAIDVYNTFANSPRVADRVDIASGGPQYLTPIDYRSGISLWDRLIRDPDSQVRLSARQELLDAHGAPYANSNYAEEGLAREDVERLANAFRQAERGENLHDPLRYAGELALKKLIERLDAPDQPL
jgi:hypothetical protein